MELSLSLCHMPAPGPDSLRRAVIVEINILLLGQGGNANNRTQESNMSKLRHGQRHFNIL